MQMRGCADNFILFHLHIRTCAHLENLHICIYAHLHIKNIKSCIGHNNLTVLNKSKSYLNLLKNIKA